MFGIKSKLKQMLKKDNSTPMPGDYKPLVTKFDEPLPFECKVSASRRTSGFYIGSDFYSGKGDLLHEFVKTITVPGYSVYRVQCYMDRYRRKLVFYHADVPHFDEYDRMYDGRFWERFCFVDDFESLLPSSLVAISGNFGDFDYWVVYDDIKNLDRTWISELVLSYYSFYPEILDSDQR